MAERLGPGGLRCAWGTSSARPPQKSARNIASMTAASCTLRFRSKSSQTLPATAAIRKPVMMARSVMGNLAQRLGGRLALSS